MSWAVAQTYASQERRAVENLQRQGYEAFCPLFAHPSKSDVSRLVESPLFACYVFVNIDLERRWVSINSTFGVIRLLTDRNKINPVPLFVPDEKIGEILSLSKTVTDPLPIGTHVRVRVHGNPFYDMIGTVAGMDRLTRISVLMTVFNRDVEVKFDPIELERA
jgi:transcriptional antiterminator RfaH